LTFLKKQKSIAKNAKKMFLCPCGGDSEGAINNVMELRVVTLQSSPEAKKPSFGGGYKCGRNGTKIKNFPAPYWSSSE